MQDGRTYTVQYFERARFEYHPDLPPGSQVQLGHLGRQYLASYPAPDWATQPVASADQAWAAIRPTRVQVPRIGIDSTVSMTGFSFGQWEVPRYTVAHYWPVSAFPGTAGNIVLAGHVGYSDTLFNYLPNIREGDEVIVTASGTERSYVVDKVLTLLPQDTWVMKPTHDETLTLITCIPIGVYSHRLIVRASPVTY
jgi:LPXTG-site transpeptidase (sortase) family protein